MVLDVGGRYCVQIRVDPSGTGVDEGECRGAMRRGGVKGDRVGEYIGSQ